MRIPIALTAGLMLFVPGCGQSTQRVKPAGKRTQAASAPLPEWAPKNPSPEFLRAAKVLKPMPPEVLGAGSGDPAKRASAERKTRIMPAGWEFFGSLTDAQIGKFQSTKEMRLPVRALTAKQRAAFEHWLEVYRQTNRGQYPPEFKDQEDLLVLIYKMGAKQDLSNVDVGFYVEGKGTVYAQFWIRQPDGTSAHMSVGSFGQI